MEAEPIISVRGLVKSYDGESILRGVDLDVFPGEILVIVGGSGSGKSTLLRQIIGADQPDEGRVKLFGDELGSMNQTQLDETRKKIGMLFQTGALFSSKTVRENVELPLREHTRLKRDVIDAIVKVKLEMVGMREHADKLPAELSGGMRKRAGFARALSLDPTVLLCDEPSAGLDPVRTAELNQLICAVSKNLGATCVIVTHEMDSALEVGDRLAMLDMGRIIAVHECEWFRRLRDIEDNTPGLSDHEQLVRQFLRGDLNGPLSQRDDPDAYDKDLFGIHPDPRTRV
jgi:phospholipid/cholesterol/gamma-HCH transport system ATP-binding protein